MKNFIRVGLSTALIASGLTFAFVAKSETQVEAANPNKVTICHRTAAVKNPYRRITVNKNSIASDITENAGGRQGHGQWSHNLWPSSIATRPVPNVFNPDWKTSVYATATQKRWGDIIPLLLDNGSTNPNVDAMGLNFTDAGEAIYNGAILNGVNYAGLCVRQTAAQFCQSHIDEGGTLAECQEELAEMGALEDEEVKKSCGGSFDGCSIEEMSVINVRTVSAVCSADVPTFSGSASTGTLAHDVKFEYGTSEFLTASVTTIAGTPASITGSGTFSATASAGLANGTYYYRAIAIDPAAEGRLDGSIASFTVTSGVCGNFTSGDPEPTPSEPTPTSTPSPTTTVAPIRGALKGVVWIDQNRNGKQDTNEPGLPFTPMLAEVAPTVSSQRLSTSGSSSSRVRKFSINATTDANGFYDVPSLDPGRWTVTATLLTSALEKTFDSSNGSTTQWFASAFVPVNGVGEADFAAAGSAQVALDVQPTAECSRTNTVEVRWAGIDTKMNTSDDVVFLATVKNQESLVRGLPWGSYLVTPICSDGTRLAPQPLVITKAQANSKTVSKMSVQLAKTGSPLLKSVLPATGQTNGGVSTGLSVLLILVGLAVLMAPRRRRIS